jgi:hypothetical protein
MDMNGINKARKIRANLCSAVDYFISNRAALDKAGDRLEWEDFENLPEWYLWDRERFQQLVLVAGTIFLLPTINLWIEAKKINVVQTMIGKHVFEFILQYTHIENSPEQQIEMNNLMDVIKTAGASVIMSSQESRLHPWLETKIPEAKKELNRKVATELLNHTLYVLLQTDSRVTNEKSGNVSEKAINDEMKGKNLS